MKSSTSCRVCKRWLEGDWSRATTDEERSSLQRQMDQGHCDGCTPPPTRVALGVEACLNEDCDCQLDLNP